MKDITELKDALAGCKALAQRLHNQVRSIRGRVESEHRDLTTAEAEQIDQLLDKADRAIAEAAVVQGEIEDAERSEVAIMAMSQPRITPNPIASPYPGGISNSAPVTGVPAIGGSFAKMFPQARASASREFSDLGSFAKAVFERNPRLFNAATGMGEGVGQDGGFYVPVQFYAGLMDGSLQQEAIRPGATVIPMTSSQVNIPMFDLSNRSTGIATMEGKLTAEGATGTTQKAKVREINLVAKKISVLVPSSIELLQDAPQLFGGLLQTAMQEALAQTLDSWFISGNGAGVPLGILSAPCTVSQAKDASQVAATITPTNIANMISRLAAGSWSKAQWIVSPSALAALFTIKTTVTNVAGTENVGGFAPEFFSVLPDGKFSLCGRPLIVSDRCAWHGGRHHAVRPEPVHDRHQAER
jgi:HK97 family phage major capsid protein